MANNIIKLLSTKFSEDEVATLEKLVPEVIKKVNPDNDIACYIEQFNDMV